MPKGGRSGGFGTVRRHHGRSNGGTLVLDPNWDSKPSPNGEFELGLCAFCENSSDCCVAFFFPCVMDCFVASTIGC